MHEQTDQASEICEFGPFQLDCRTRELRRGSQPIALTPKAFDMLRALISSRGRVVEKRELMELVWPDSFVGEDNLTQHIAMLRKALGDSPQRPCYIATIPRHANRFLKDVRARPAASPVEVQTPHLRSMPRRAIAAIAGVCIAACTAAGVAI